MKTFSVLPDGSITTVLGKGNVIVGTGLESPGVGSLTFFRPTEPDVSGDSARPEQIESRVSTFVFVDVAAVDRLMGSLLRIKGLMEAE